SRTLQILQRSRTARAAVTIDATRPWPPCRGTIDPDRGSADSPHQEDRALRGRDPVLCDAPIGSELAHASYALRSANDSRTTLLHPQRPSSTSGDSPDRGRFTSLRSSQFMTGA